MNIYCWNDYIVAVFAISVCLERDILTSGEERSSIQSHATYMDCSVL